MFWSAVRAISSSRVRVCSTRAEAARFINEPAGGLANARRELFFGNSEQRSGATGTVWLDRAEAPALPSVVDAPTFRRSSPLPSLTSRLTP